MIFVKPKALIVTFDLLIINYLYKPIDNDKVQVIVVYFSVQQN